MFVHINKKANFTDELKSKYVNSIVFIKDSQEIWTHDTFYAIPEEYKNKILELEQKVGGSIIFLTQEEYDLLGTDLKKDAIYIITNDTPELKVQGPFIANNGLLEEAANIENNQHYVFKVNKEYFFIYKSNDNISLPNDPSLYKHITGNFETFEASHGSYEYCVPEIIDVESLDDTGIESLLKDITIVDNFRSYGANTLNYNSSGFYTAENDHERGSFYGFYVYTNGDIGLQSDKVKVRYKQGDSEFITYKFPKVLCTYDQQEDKSQLLISQCLNKNYQSFFIYSQDYFESFKSKCNINQVEIIRKSNILYNRELTAIGKKINIDLNNRLDFGVDSNIIVGRIIKFNNEELNYYIDVKNDTPNINFRQVSSIGNTNNVYWLETNGGYLTLVVRGDKIIPEPPNVVKLRVKNDLTTLKYNSVLDVNYFPVSVENIEEFNDDDVTEFLSNIIVPAVDGIDKDDTQEQFTSYSSNPWVNSNLLPKQDIQIIFNPYIHTGLKIGKGNPDITNTYEYRFSEYRSTLKGSDGGQYKKYYSPIIVPGDYECRKYEYSIDSNVAPYVSEIISTGKYKRLVYNTTIGFNCPSYIIPSLYYYLHLDIRGFTNKVIDTVELIAPSNCKYDTFIKALEDNYNIDLSNRFSYDEGTVSKYMLLYVKTKLMD